MDDDHAALRFQQVDVVDHFGPPAVHVEDGLAHQVLVEQHPAGMIDEGRILLAVSGGWTKMASSSIFTTRSQGMNSVGLPQPCSR